jgi:hypothetical protein
MRGMRNVAAEKTTPLRLDPDPARACSAPIACKSAASRADTRVRRKVPACRVTLNL